MGKDLPIEYKVKKCALKMKKTGKAYNYLTFDFENYNFDQGNSKPKGTTEKAQISRLWQLI